MNKMLGLRLTSLALLVYAIWYAQDNFDGIDEKYATIAILLMATIIVVVHAISAIYDKLDEIHKTLQNNQRIKPTEKTG